MSANTTDEDDTSMSSSAGNGRVAPAYEPDENWEDCSLCDVGDCQFNGERVPLPGREALTSDMEAFLQHIQRVKHEPRSQMETPFNEHFWVFVKNILEQAKPLGYTDMCNRYQAMPKGPADNEAFIGKYISLAPLNPIYPNVLAEMSGVPLNDVLTELLHASTTGMLTMRFSPFCERCGSPTCAQTGIIDAEKLPIVAFCRTCRFSNPIDCMEKIKVVFILNTDVLYVLVENLPCKPSKHSYSLSEILAMVPATFSGSGFRFSFGCDGDMALRPAFNAGKYRMHCTISMSDVFLVVERDATEADEPYTLKVHVSDLDYRGGPRKIVTVPHGKVRIECYCDTKTFFILWVQQNVDTDQLFYVPPEERPVSSSALQVMSHLSYRALYEGTEEEAQNFSGAVAEMAMDPGNTAEERVNTGGVSHSNVPTHYS